MKNKYNNKSLQIVIIYIIKAVNHDYFYWYFEQIRAILLYFIQCLLNDLYIFISCFSIILMDILFCPKYNEEILLAIIYNLKCERLVIR